MRAGVAEFRVRVRLRPATQPPSPWQPRATSHRVSRLVRCTDHPRDLVELISWLVPRLQLNRTSTHRHPSRVYPPPPQQHRMLQSLRAEEHSHTRGSVQRYSHRRVAARACGTRAASRSCPPRPRPGNADFSLHVLRAVEGGPGSWEGAVISLLREGVLELPACDTAPWLAASFCRACGDVVPTTSLLSSSSRCRSRRLRPFEESRLLCRPEAWEGGIPAHRRGHALVMLCFVALYTDLSQLQAVSRLWPTMSRLPQNQIRPPRKRM